MFSWLLAHGSSTFGAAKPALGVQGGHAAGAGGGDRLAVVVVGHVAGGEHALDAGVGAERLSST